MKCPRCQVELQSGEKEHAHHCPQCDGWFVECAGVSGDLLESADDAPQQEELACPSDGTPMRTVLLDSLALDRCDLCHGVWLDAGESLDREGFAKSLSRYLLYSATLPERVVRSSVGLAAGAASEAAAFLVPQAFQNAKTYEIVVRNSLGFLTRDIGGVQKESADGDEAEDGQDDYMARKAVGNFVDLAGLATLHVSPVWFMAIVSDVAYGANSYVKELAGELQKQGLIEEDAAIHNVEDVLTAVQNASGNAASMFDTPPLSVDQLKETLVSTKDSLQSTDLTKLMPEAELKRYWEEMKGVASQEGVSLLGVSGAVTMSTLDRMKTVTQGTLTGVKVAGGLVNDLVVGHYIDSLKSIHEHGFYETIRDTSAPYVEAVWSNFASDKPTWTEELLSGRAIKKGLSGLTGWFRGKEK